MDWLNRGMEVCVPAVTKRGGMVNNQDAVFGVPLEQDTAANQAAIDAAREIKTGLEQLNQELQGREPSGWESTPVRHWSTDAAEHYAGIGDIVHHGWKALIKSVMTVSWCWSPLDLLSDDVRRALNLSRWGPVKVKGRDQLLDVGS